MAYKMAKGKGGGKKKSAKNLQGKPNPRACAAEKSDYHYGKGTNKQPGGKLGN